MPDYTENYNLAKPLKSEKFKTTTQNENIDKIDQELKNVNDQVDEVKKAITTKNEETEDKFAKLQEEIKQIESVSMDEVKNQIQSLDNTVTTINKNIRQIGDKTEEIDREVVKLQEDIKQIQGVDISGSQKQIGDLQALKTTDKDNLVSATNEVVANVTAMKEYVNELVGDVGWLADRINRKVV